MTRNNKVTVHFLNETSKTITTTKKEAQRGCVDVLLTLKHAEKNTTKQSQTLQVFINTI